MAVWQLDIEKSYQGEYWTNVYHCNAAAQGDARAIALEIIAAERAIHSNQVSFTKFRVRPYPSAGQQGTVYGIGQTGTVGSLNHLPLFNVLTVLFTVASGRPSRKYLRLPLGEGAVENGAIEGNSLIALTAAYCTPLESVEGLSDSQGNPFIAIGCQAPIGMRQLRRGSRRRSNPVI